MGKLFRPLDPGLSRKTYWMRLFSDWFDDFTRSCGQKDHIRWARKQFKKGYRFTDEEIQYIAALKHTLKNGKDDKEIEEINQILIADGTAKMFIGALW